MSITFPPWKAGSKNWEGCKAFPIPKNNEQAKNRKGYNTMMKLNKWESLTMGEIENLAGKIATGELIEYQVGGHKLKTVFNEEMGLLRTVRLDTMEIIESEGKEWFYSDLLLVLIRHLFMAMDD